MSTAAYEACTSSVFLRAWLWAANAAVSLKTPCQSLNGWYGPQMGAQQGVCHRFVFLDLI